MCIYELTGKWKDNFMQKKDRQDSNIPSYNKMFTPQIKNRLKEKKTKQFTQNEKKPVECYMKLQNFLV